MRHSSRASTLWCALLWFSCSVVLAQEPPPSNAGVTPENPGNHDTAPPPQASDGQTQAPNPQPQPPAAETPPAEPPRGDTPITPEAVVSPEAQKLLEAAELPEPTAAPRLPAGDRGPRSPARVAPKRPEIKVSQPLVLWASAGLGKSLGPAYCGPNGMEGMDEAIRIASTMKRSVSVAGFGVAPAGALSDHPLIAHAAHTHPQQLAQWLARAGFSALYLGVSDLRGPLLREPQLTAALVAQGISVVASNFVCGGRDFCNAWSTAEDPLPVIERDGRKYALVSLLPDDLLSRVEPTGNVKVELRPAAQTLVARVTEADAQGADLIVASIDHGPDPTAAVQVADFLAQLPVDKRPELLFSPSTGENLLFMRPLDVQPAVVGTRPAVLTGLRVTKLAEQRDSDVFARSVRLHNWDDELASELARMGSDYCHEYGAPLPGGALQAPLDADGFVQLAAAAARELADADLALIDPAAYDRQFGAGEGQKLQRGVVERGVQLDAPLVVADVQIEWLNNANKLLEGLRPLVLIGTARDGNDALIAGRLAVPGARYRIVTTSVLARSGRLPAGATFSPLTEANASLRGALIAHLRVAEPGDPRSRLRDPTLGTQWVLRTDGQLLANLTTVRNYERKYDDPALTVNNSSQFGVRLVINLDADAPKFLFENLAQVAFDRNFATSTTSQDLIFLQNTYTYRGLWPSALFYPHPFAESYVESAFIRIKPADQAPYRHLLLRPKAGLRSMASRVLSLKVFGDLQYEVFSQDAEVRPGVGAELLLKPWTVATSNGTMQLEGNITYLWDAPGNKDNDRHTLRGQLIGSYQLIGPLQVTLTTLGTVRKDRHLPLGMGLGAQIGIRLRYVSRSMSD